MRSVRSYLYKNREFIFPEDESFAALSTFYGVLAGLQEREEPFSVDMGSGNQDREGMEIYENDIVEINFTEGKKKVTGEICTVRYEDGCFVAVSSHGWVEDIGSYAEDMLIVGNEYEYEMD